MRFLSEPSSHANRLPALLITVAGHGVLCACLLAAPMMVTSGSAPSVVSVSVLPDASHRDILLAPQVHLLHPKAEHLSAPRLPTMNHDVAVTQSRASAAGSIPQPPSKVNTVRENENYPAQVSFALARVKHYPLSERMAHHQGRVWLCLQIAADGSLLKATVQHSSGVASLDRAALAMAHMAAPFPPVPAGKTISLAVPVSFSLES